MAFGLNVSTDFCNNNCHNTHEVLQEKYGLPNVNRYLLKNIVLLLLVIVITLKHQVLHFCVIRMVT